MERLDTVERLHNLLPAGGVIGTIQNAIKTDNGLSFNGEKQEPFKAFICREDFLLPEEVRNTCIDS